MKILKREEKEKRKRKKKKKKVLCTPPFTCPPTQPFLPTSREVSSSPPPFGCHFSSLFYDFFSINLFPLPLSGTLSSNPTMETLRQCCVCLEQMRETVKTLPCLHSACLGCLEQWIAKSTPPQKKKRKSKSSQVKSKSKSNNKSSIIKQE